MIAAWKSGVEQKKYKIESIHLIIEYLATTADYQNLDEIRGQYGSRIKIYLPCQNLENATEDFWADVEPFVASVLVQEATHHLQKQAHPEEFKIASKRQEEWKKSIFSRKDVAAEEYLANYYDTPFEFEAHAAQVAAEMLLSGDVSNATRTWQRMSGRLQAALDPTADFGSKFANAVQEHYSTWAVDCYSR